MRKSWLVTITVVYTAAVACIIVATVIQGWYEVSCEGPKQLHVGLWGMCAEYTTNTSTTRGAETVMDCGDIQHALQHGHLPGYMKGTQLLSFANMAGSSIFVLLLFGYCFVPEPVSLDAAGGFSAASMATVAFCLTTILNASIALADLPTRLAPSMCRPLRVEASISFALTCAGGLLALIPCLIGLYIHQTYPPEMVERLKNKSGASIKGLGTSAMGRTGNPQSSGGLQTKMFANSWFMARRKHQDGEPENNNGNLDPRDTHPRHFLHFRRPQLSPDHM